MGGDLGNRQSGAECQNSLHADVERRHYLLLLRKEFPRGALLRLLRRQRVGLSGRATLNIAAHSLELGKPSWYYTQQAYGKLKDYGFKAEYNATRETVYFREMILRDVQGVRFMKRYFGADGPDVRFKGLWSDKKILTLSGGSQGGFQCAAVAALEPGVTQAMLYIPWLCDIGGCGTDGRQASTFMPTYTEALE